MFVSELRTGSLVVDIDGHRLDAKFIRETGAIDDSFTIIKGAPPEPLRLATLTVGFGTVIARWKSIAGHNYQLQSTPSLDAPQWTALGDPVTATGATTSSTNAAPNGAAQGFYRVIELPQ
jgi:hypothetical protein